jgi:predicted RecB family nuclease
MASRVFERMLNQTAEVQRQQEEDVDAELRKRKAQAGHHALRSKLALSYPMCAVWPSIAEHTTAWCV